ncbi:MAG: hypothetical protein HZB26_02250 [Candidatus Hydrogenedentes bacterium]|nr:hypothetical protein [Candidatus Hydrogenedentota bacterium]
MNKQYILTIVVFIALAGVTAAVYQFYFRERLDAYAENEKKYEALSKRLDTISKAFSNTKPDAVVTMWSNAVIPWRDAVAQRSEYFNLKEVYEADPPPEGVMLKFYYETESNRLIGQLYQAAAMRNPPCNLPIVASTYFDAPSMSQLAGVSVTKENVTSWLQQIRLGCYVTKQLLDSGVSRIYDLNLWPKRVENGSLEMHTAGVSVSITAQNLFTFMDKLQTSTRYICVNAIKISNRYLYSGGRDPQLEVQMLITQARHVESAPGAAPAPPVAGTPAAAPGATPNLQMLKPGGGGNT